MSPPFDEEKYKALTSGLKCSEVSAKTLHLRLDAEYYITKPIEASGIRSIPLEIEAAKITQGSNPCFSDNGFICLNGKNVYWGTMTVGEANYVSQIEFDRLSSFALKEKDIVITLKHASKIGRAWIVEDGIPRIFSRNIGLIRLKENAKIMPEYTLFYLWSQYGQAFLDHNTTGGTNGQITLPISALRKMPIPVASMALQKKVKMLYDTALRKQNKSTNLYAFAEQALLAALGVEGFVSSAEPVAIKLFSESFGANGRLDAEYYQAKYESLFAALSGLPCEKLGKIATIEKSIEPGSEHYGDEGVPFVRVSDITKYGISPTTVNIPANLTLLRPKKDTILLSKDGSVGIAYKAEEDMDVITSGALLHLTVKNEDVLPDYLALVLNSVVVRMQAERDVGGSIIQHWKPSEVAAVIIPILDNIAQSAIAEQVKQSFALRRQSEQLLELSKSVVEIAIEQGEEKAIAWLDGKGVEI